MYTYLIYGYSIDEDISVSNNQVFIRILIHIILDRFIEVHGIGKVKHCFLEMKKKKKKKQQKKEEGEERKRRMMRRRKSWPRNSGSSLVLSTVWLVVTDDHGNGKWPVERLLRSAPPLETGARHVKVGRGGYSRTVVAPCGSVVRRPRRTIEVEEGTSSSPSSRRLHRLAFSHSHLSAPSPLILLLDQEWQEYKRRNVVVCPQ